MKIRRLLIQLLLFFLPSIFQAQACEVPVSVFELFENQLEIHISHGENDFMSFGDDIGVEVPEEGGAALLYYSEFWIGGKSPDNQLKLAAGQGDYFAGPLTVGDAEVDQETCEDYDRFFFLTLEQSLTHLAYYNAVQNGTDLEEFPDGYEIPEVFYEYPAHGALGQAEYLAPFYDFDGNGLYNPEFGDCPAFDSMAGVENLCQSCMDYGLSGEVCLFWITNDKGNVHTNSGGQPLGVEIHNCLYAFVGETGILDHTIFLKKKIFNRGTQTLLDTYAGMMVDGDVGSGSDDYVGCDIDRNLAYFINGDAVDEPSSSSPGFGMYPPALGVLTLTGLVDELDNDSRMSSFMSYNNSSNPGTGEPQIANEHYNYLSGYWRDGTPVTCGGTGYSEGIEQTTYMFPGASGEGDCLGWSEESEGNSSGDRRGLVSSGPITLEPQDTQCFEFAFIYARDEDEDGDVLEELVMASDSVQAFYDDCFESVYTSVIEFPGVLEVDFNYNQITGILKVKDPVDVTVFNSLGQMIENKRSTGYLEFDLSSLNTGIYFLNFQDGSGAVLNEKIFIK